MKPSHRVVTVPALLLGAVIHASASQTTPRKASEPRREMQTPPGWSATLSKTIDLELQGKLGEVVAIYENTSQRRNQDCRKHSKNFSQGQLGGGACQLINPYSQGKLSKAGARYRDQLAKPHQKKTLHSSGLGMDTLYYRNIVRH